MHSQSKIKHQHSLGWYILRARVSVPPAFPLSLGLCRPAVLPHLRLGPQIEIWQSPVEIHSAGQSKKGGQIWMTNSCFSLKALIDKVVSGTSRSSDDLFLRHQVAERIQSMEATDMVLGYYKSIKKGFRNRYMHTWWPSPKTPSRTIGSGMKNLCMGFWQCHSLFGIICTSLFMSLWLMKLSRVDSSKSHWNLFRNKGHRIIVKNECSVCTHWTVTTLGKKKKSFPKAVFLFLITDITFTAVLDSQQNWEESTVSSHMHPVPTQAQPPPLPASPTKGEWAFTDTS